MTSFFYAILLMVFALIPSVAHAQIGVTNPTTLAPNQVNNQPFGTDPHPFNNAHPAQPWSQWNATTLGAPVRIIEMPAQLTEVPMEVPQPGSLPNNIERVKITLPGYQIVETTIGYVVYPRWSVMPRSDGVYYWAWIPLQFQRK